VKRKYVAAGLSACLTAGAGAVLVGLLAVLPSYGWTLFVGLPLLLGVSCGAMMNLISPSTAGATISATLLSLTLLAGALLLWRIEGAFCLLLAVPIAVPLALLGAVLGRTLSQNTPGRHQHAALLVLPLAGLPIGAAERIWFSDSTVRPVVTAVEIDSPPKPVWQFVLQFPELPPPTEWYFQAGLAYPLRAD
jgi:hypothetical protein